MYDILFKNAVVIDGLGNDPVKSDVAVKDGDIRAIGPEILGEASAVIDADGLYLCPGFVDIHTHYDAQISWDRSLSPSSELGVSTVVMGNCGFGIVPCASPQNSDTIMKNLSVVEGMDLDSLRAGLRWDYADYAGYRNFVEAQAPYLNVGILIGHSAVRLDAMNGAASDRRVPTAEETRKMRETVRKAIQAGAIGFASSFSPNHSGYGGVPMPSTIAEEAELVSLVDVLKEEGSGVFQIAAGARAGVDFLESISERTGRPVSMSGGMTLYSESQPDRAKATLDRCAAAIERGNPVYGQVSCQPLSMDFTPRDPYPFYTYSALNAVRNVEDDGKLRAVYADPSFRSMLREQLKAPDPAAAFSGNWARVVVTATGRAANEHLCGRSIAQIAAQNGADAIDSFFDLALADDLDTTFVGLLYNAVDEGVKPLLTHDAGIIALSDAGAHLGSLCDAGYGLYLLGHWVRERGDFEWADAVRRLTSLPAKRYGIRRRGRIAVGAHADILLFDPKTVGISGLLKRSDLPGGASRMVREAFGVEGLWVNGVQVAGKGGLVPLDKGPGRVLDRFD
jgi:N-acyl-D-aspartate/D-glutamate deacylase